MATLPFPHGRLLYTRVGPFRWEKMARSCDADFSPFLYLAQVSSSRAWIFRYFLLWILFNFFSDTSRIVIVVNFASLSWSSNREYNGKWQPPPARLLSALCHPSMSCFRSTDARRTPLVRPSAAIAPAASGAGTSGVSHGVAGMVAPSACVCTCIRRRSPCNRLGVRVLSPEKPKQANNKTTK